VQIRLSHVARSSVLIAGLFAIDKLLGLVRQAIIGRQFGLSSELDAFNAANNLPDLLFAVISGGALAIALIPVLSSTIEKAGKKAAWELFSRVANWAFLITGVFGIGIAIFATTIVTAEIGIAPGFTPDLQRLVVDLMRLNLLATLVFSLSGLVMAGLQANQHFLLPALAPILYDVGQIIGALFLAPEGGVRLGGVETPTAGLGIHGLVYGVILGALLHLGIQVPALIKFGFRWLPRLGLLDKDLRRVADLMGPRILTIGAFQLIFVIQDNLASRLDVGAVTALTYGWLIMQVPETIIGTAVGTAILPTLSELFSKGDADAFSRRVGRAVRILFALTLPAAVLLSVGIQPFIQAAFQFNLAETEMIVRAAQAFLLGLVGHSLVEVGARAFYARHNARLPLLASGISAGSFILLSLLLFNRFGPVGIGLSNSLAFSIEALFLLLILTRLLPGILPQRQVILRVILGSVVGGIVTFGVLEIIPGSNLVQGIAALLAGGLLTLPFIMKELREIGKL
jgi:putative peptidoglycan lipid II flippase